jgi:hypothetical protein
LRIGAKFKKQAILTSEGVRQEDFKILMSPDHWDYGEKSR